MRARTTGRHHASALLPAAMLSLVVSAPWGGAAAPTAEPAAAPVPPPAYPAVPTDALEAPGSVAPREVDGSRTDRGFDPDSVDAESVTGIPDAALAAYQRAETVINAADKTCNIDWQLIASVGRVESDHGRYGGSALDDKGVARPGILGIALDGSNDTAVIRDTDAGQYDRDDRWDRAVGPMQFIPSTWAVVGVDGDNDGERNPQDIDDAALATAVYLCSGNGDLSREVGRRSAVYRYNHSHDYVDLVLAFREAYLKGDFEAVAAATTWSGSFERPATVAEATPEARDPRRSPATRTGRDDQRDSGLGGKPTGGATTPPEQPETPPTDDGTDPEEPGTDEPVTEEPGTEEPPTEEPGTEEPPTEDPGTEEPPTEDPGTEEPPTEDPGTTDPGTDPDGGVETPDEPETTPTEEEAVALCLAQVGATADQLPDLEALGLLADYTTCMTGLGFPPQG